MPNRSKNLKKILTQIQSEEMIGLWEKYSVEVTWGGGGGRGHGGEIPPPAAVDRPNQADSPPPPLSDKHLPG